IELILDPPKPEMGAVYEGKVVNITKFGAFVNIIPGRDGLLHISKLGQGKRVERVEDVLALGDSVSVRVDDIDQQGKVALSLVGDAPEGDGGGNRDREPASVGASSSRSSSGGASGGGGGGGDREYVSFE